MAAVVVVEDDLHIRQAVARVLADMGHDVVSAGAALAGLEAVVQRAPTWCSSTWACPTSTAPSCSR